MRPNEKALCCEVDLTHHRWVTMYNVLLSQLNGLVHVFVTSPSMHARCLFTDAETMLRFAVACVSFEGLPQPP